MGHKIELNDVQCLVVLDALYHLQQNKIKHEADKRLADEICTIIIDTVKSDKAKHKPVDLDYKCGSCKYLDYSEKRSIGYLCRCPREFKSNLGMFKYKTTKCCKYYVKGTYSNGKEQSTD